MRVSQIGMKCIMRYGLWTSVSGNLGTPFLAIASKLEVAFR